MNPFNFLSSVFNQMLINPRSCEGDKKDQYQLKLKFEEIYGDKNYFLIPSSGSSTAANESVKLIALHQDAILNSAKRVNSFFNLDKVHGITNFGCVLPTFHIGGLGIYARSFLAKGQVHQQPWKPEELQAWLETNQIHVLSLVPTQVYDIVQRKIPAPSALKVVFIGGAKLSADLSQKIETLGWPVVETYGMTETGSMIAGGKNMMEVLPDIDVVLNDGKLKIRCNSLMTCSLQKIDDNVHIVTLDNGWLQTKDAVELKSAGSKTVITFQGRDGNFIKINSEGVSLSQLRNFFGEHDSLVLLAMPSDRTGNEIVAVYEATLAAAEAKSHVQLYNERVRPFEKIKKVYNIAQIPRTELNKIKYPAIADLIKGKNYETI